MKLAPVLALAMITLFTLPAQAGEARPTVVELFTAQGCPSCPRADAVLREIAGHPGFLPLSFHVTYFDNEGWKDPHSRPENNLRQMRYLSAIGLKEAFTPHMVVDGTISMTGGNAEEVGSAIDEARKLAVTIPLSITLNDSQSGLKITLGDAQTPIPMDSTLYEVHFQQRTVTPIKAGGNAGLTTENVNNVISYMQVPISAEYFVPMARLTGDGIAYLLHNKEGRVIGAAYYLKPAAQQ